MDIGCALLAVGAGERPDCFEAFTHSLDPAWIDQALAATGTATVRRRKLPAEQVVWTVIAVALFRDRSIQEVVRHLSLVLPPPGVPAGRGAITGGGVAQARERLGPTPLAQLFELAAVHWASASADAHRWRDLALYGLEGSTLRIPDTPENEAAFGRPPNARGNGAHPQLRVVALMVLRSHSLAGLSLGSWATGEVTLALPLWRKVPALSLPKSYYDGFVREFQSRRDLLLELFREEPAIRCQPPRGAFYLMATLPVDDAESYVRWLLTEYEKDGETVMMAPGDGFYATPGMGKREVRIAYVFESTVLRRAAEIIVESLRTYPARTE